VQNLEMHADSRLRHKRFYIFIVNTYSY